MLANENTVIELHSQRCRCRGYAWNARRHGMPLPTSGCRDGRTTPDGAVWVASQRWLELGMPRTTEQYYDAERQRPVVVEELLIEAEPGAVQHA